MPKVSVVIPVYNNEKYLNQCFESLINQTLEDFEVICLHDNGSKDNSLEVIKSFAQKDSRFKFFEREHENPGEARNCGIEQAQGEYLLCLDCDDWLEENALELAYNKIKQAQTDILFFDVYRYIEKTGEKYIHKYTQIYNKFGEKSFNKTDAEKSYFLTNGLPYKFYNLNFIKVNNIKYSSHKFIEDASFYIKSMLLANSISCLCKPIYNYRVSKNSATYNYNNYLESIPEVYDICFDLISKLNTDEKILKSFLINRKRAMLHFYKLTPQKIKKMYYKMMQKIIKKHFTKYNLDSQLKEIMETPFLIFHIKQKIRRLKYIFSVYFI